MLNLVYKLGKFIKYKYNFMYAFMFGYYYELNLYSFVYLLKCVGKNVIIGTIIYKTAEFLIKNYTHKTVSYGRH